MDQRFHVALHLFAARRADLAIVDHHRTRIGAQPLDALLDDAVGLAHFFDAHQVAVVAVAVHADGDVEVHVGIDLVGLLLAQVPGDARAAQHRPGEAQLHRALGRDDADVHRALLPDAVVGEQGFVFVDAGREAAREVLDEIQQRARARLVQPVGVLLRAPARGLVLRHRLRQVAVDAARAIVGGVHARARDRLVAVHQVFALAEAEQEHAHRADVEAMRAQPHQVVQDARDLVEHHADVLRAHRHLHAQQAFSMAIT